ncbi:hypothetical protein CLV58_109115 [Spirosoma oryzae]|uniref:Uncharacterized protein n=1 Tax=Spirosoma oryzae TaxID=1469603 RepID=A0A2T0SY94_9BACT|nr:hypothetical protein [Spirosoma oryzae]PRY38388.1 hypothetical protein CLV58_109115 [Spirosoma oryzae]
MDELFKWAVINCLLLGALGYGWYRSVVLKPRRAQKDQFVNDWLALQNQIWKAGTIPEILACYEKLNRIGLMTRTVYQNDLVWGLWEKLDKQGREILDEKKRSLATEKRRLGCFN